MIHNRIRITFSNHVTEYSSGRLRDRKSKQCIHDPTQQRMSERMLPVSYYCSWCWIPPLCSLSDCQTIAGLSKVPLLLLSPICLSSSLPLLYLVPPLFSSRLTPIAAGQSAVTGEQWGNCVCVHTWGRKMCEREEGKQVTQKERKMVRRQNTVFGFDEIPQIYWQILWCQVFPLSKSTVTPVLLCLSPPLYLTLSISVAS